MYTHTLTNVQVWDRFLQVYKEIIRLLLGRDFWETRGYLGLTLEADPEDGKYANPETDFRAFSASECSETPFSADINPKCNTQVFCAAIIIAQYFPHLMQGIRCALRHQSWLD
jgi:hypothetical protein